MTQETLLDVLADARHMELRMCRVAASEDHKSWVLIHGASCESTRMGAGTAERFERLYHEHSVPVFNLLRRLLRNEQEAEDATVETFRRIYQSLAGFRDDCPERVWVMRIAHREASRAASKRSHEAALSLDAPEGAWSGWGAAVVESGEEFILERQEAETYLASIPMPQRLAVWMRVALEYTDEDVAQIMDVPVGTVKSWIRRSLLRLRREMTEGTAEGGA